VQVLVVSSKKVNWAKQGTCKIVDDEPTPPTQEGYESHQGWKEVTGFVTSMGGGTFLFPEDQLMVVLTNGKYKPIASDEQRQLGKLAVGKTYLVWYHHLLTPSEWQKKRARAHSK
jgi:hypothetical protein